jgi:hypothetical protein
MSELGGVEAKRDDLTLAASSFLDISNPTGSPRPRMSCQHRLWLSIFIDNCATLTIQSAQMIGQANRHFWRTGRA